MSSEPPTRRQHKWGHSDLLLRTPTLELWRIEGRKGGASSFHTHARKSNTFLVATGRIVIETEEYDFDPIMLDPDFRGGKIYVQTTIPTSPRAGRLRMR